MKLTIVAATGGIGRQLLEAKWRLVLANFDLEFRELVPIDEDIGRAKFCPGGVGSERPAGRISNRQRYVALLEFSLDLKIKLVREIAG